MMKKVIISIVVCILAIVVFVVATADSHHTNAKYLAWKYGLSKFNPAIAFRYLNVDVNFRQSLHGKTKSEVQKWFPDLRLPSNANYYQSLYSQYFGEVDYLWIGESTWGIVFQDGKLKEFILMKG